MMACLWSSKQTGFHTVNKWDSFKHKEIQFNEWRRSRCWHKALYSLKQMTQLNKLTVLALISNSPSPWPRGKDTPEFKNHHVPKILFEKLISHLHTNNVIAVAKHFGQKISFLSPFFLIETLNQTFTTFYPQCCSQCRPQLFRARALNHNKPSGLINSNWTQTLNPASNKFRNISPPPSGTHWLLPSPPRLCCPVTGINTLLKGAMTWCLKTLFQGADI